MRPGSLAADLLPPALLRFLRTVRDRIRNRGRAEWEFIPGSEPTEIGVGWNVHGVVTTEVAKWNAFREAVSSTQPLGVSHEGALPLRQTDAAHHTTVTFGFVLARAALRRDSLSLLDWGGSLGHYYLLARALLPEVEIEYHCKEVELLCEAGRRLLPEATFHHDEETALGQTYDLVLASGSLQYAPDWEASLARLGAAAQSFLFITRLPIVHGVPSFRVLQRARRHGYDTEYAGWVLNRVQLLRQAEAAGLKLDREFLVEERPNIRNAPEPVEYRGFLFRAPS